MNEKMKKRNSEKFKKEKFDIVLMDIRMPVMDGVQATQEIRAFENKNSLAETPIVALTANVLKEDIEKYLKVGMNAHLAKPLRTLA